MARTGLDSLIDRINYLVEADAGFHKKANISETDVLGGDRTDTKGGGVTHPDPDKEMDGSVLSQGRPVEESYDPNKEKDKLLEEQRQQEVAQVGEMSVDTSFSNNETPQTKVEKAAHYANYIINLYKKAQEEKEKEKEKEDTNKPCDSEDEEPMMDDYEASKEAGARAFHDMLQKEGADFLVRTAAAIDPTFKAYQEYGQGMALADLAIEKVAQELKKKEDDEECITTDQEKKAYDLGARLAEETLKKVAADLVAVRPVIQELLAKNILTEEERDALISALASSDTLTPESVQGSVSGLSNADAVAEAIIKAIEGPQGANVVPPPSNIPMPTPEALPASSPTVDDSPPETATVDVGTSSVVDANTGNEPSNANVELQAQELIDAVQAAASAPPASPEDELIIAAALKVLKKGRK